MSARVTGLIVSCLRHRSYGKYLVKVDMISFDVNAAMVFIREGVFIPIVFYATCTSEDVVFKAQNTLLNIYYQKSRL